MLATKVSRDLSVKEQQHERTVKVAMMLAVTLPNPLGGNGLSLGFENAASLDPDILDEVVSRVRMAILRRVKFVAGRMPLGGMRVTMSLALPHNWGTFTADREQMAREMAEKVGNAVEEVMKDHGRA